jgi:hypothetical protein
MTQLTDERPPYEQLVPGCVRTGWRFAESGPEELRHPHAATLCRPRLRPGTGHEEEHTPLGLTGHKGNGAQGEEGRGARGGLPDRVKLLHDLFAHPALAERRRDDCPPKGSCIRVEALLPQGPAAGEAGK